MSKYPRIQPRITAVKTARKHLNALGILAEPDIEYSFRFENGDFNPYQIQEFIRKSEYEPTTAFCIIIAHEELTYPEVDEITSYPAVGKLLLVKPKPSLV